MTLISASRRTDLPAFYGPWFMNRLRQGHCLVRHPFRADLVRRVDLSPQAVEGIIFWTRNPRPFLPHLQELDRLGRPYYVQMTLTGHPPVLEPNLPPADGLIRCFEELGRFIGAGRLIWRFDPLLLTPLTPPEEIKARFERLSDRLAGQCRRVVISLAQLYHKTKRRLVKVPDLTVTDLGAEENQGLAIDLLGALAAVAQDRDLEMNICASERDYSYLGISPGKCIDEAVLNDFYGLKLSYPGDPGQRPACNCAQSIDIGAYNTCLHGCLYCYATAGPVSAQKNYQTHDPEGEALVGSSNREL